MKLEIISPEKTCYSGQAEMVMLPGLQGAFTILENHAPIISGLNKGTVVYRAGGKEQTVAVAGGFAEAKANVVTVCVEDNHEE